VRVLFASTRGAGHFNPLVPFIEGCRRGGHEVLVVVPPDLVDAVRRAGYRFRVGAAPPEDELGRVWARVPTVSYDDAERLVFGELFATLNVRAMLPGMRTTVREWRPDVIVREHAEFASFVVAEEAGVPHLQVGISLAATHMKLLRIAAEALEAWRTGLTDRIAETPYLTLFPASLEDPEVAGPPRVHRFRDPAADAPECS
jgi:UDP:flavonoid glycosyltransferase YjiC (YdhE family)